MRDSKPSVGKESFLVVWGNNTVCGLQCALGPATSFRAVGPSLRLGPRGQEIARFRNGLWTRRKTGGRFQYLWTERSVLLRLEDPASGRSLPLGNFEMIGILANAIYGEREHSRMIATLDEQTGMWHSLHDHQKWPELTLQPVAQAIAWPTAVVSGLSLPRVALLEPAPH